jgi:hypothetical protein
MKRLKLLALDDEDLNIVSAHVQDAVLKIADIDFNPKQKKFVLKLNRFVWEQAEGKSKTDPFERRLSVLHFDRVENAQHTGFNLEAKDAVLSLLAIRFNETNFPAGTIELLFSGDAAIRLHVEVIEAQLSDMDASWGSEHLPKHEISS